MGFMLDTSPEARAAYFRIIASKTPAQRALLTQSLSERIRLASMAGIRRQNPEFTDREVKLAYARRIMTEDEFNTMFPSA